MSRIAAIDPTTTEGKTRETLAAVNTQLGATPNLFRVAANAPAVLDALVGLIGALGRGALRPKTREAIALTVAEANGCDYCLSAHSALGRGAGLSDDAIARARLHEAEDPKVAAMLAFADKVVAERGRAGLAAVREAGVTDAEALEVVANVALNILTNYINLVADTDVDFPLVRAHSS